MPAAPSGTAFGLLLAGPVALGFTAVILRRAKWRKSPSRR